MITVIGCVIAASIVAICSIFCFFGPVFSYVSGDSSIVPSMFNYMFGSKKGIIIWEQKSGFIILFVLQLLIILGFIVTIFILHNKNKSNKLIMGSIIGLIVLSLVATIMSFCSISLTGIDSSLINLGVGPIIYSVMHLVVIIILLVACFNFYTKEIQNPTVVENKSTATQVNVNSTSKIESNQSKEVLSESAKIDLLNRYKKMLDEGTLTQEEFDAKKKDLL
jgi:uncharacterized membrane protein